MPNASHSILPRFSQTNCWPYTNVRSGVVIFNAARTVTLPSGVKKRCFEFNEKRRNLAEGLLLFTDIFSEEELATLETHLRTVQEDGKHGRLAGEVKISLLPFDNSSPTCLPERGT